MRIAVDLDSTMAQNVVSMLKLYNSIHGTSYTKENITDYEFWNLIEFDVESKSRTPWGSSPKNKELAYRLMDKAWENWQQIEPEPGALTAMRVLNNLRRSLDLQIDIVTGRDTTPPEIIEAWLKLNGIQYDRLVVTHGKYKAKLNYDIFIDDSPFVAQEMVNYPDKLLILYSQPWNRHVRETSNIKRMDSWKQVLLKLGITFRAGQVRSLGRVRVNGYRRHI